MQDEDDCLPLGLDGRDKGQHNIFWRLERVQEDVLVTADLMTLTSSAEAISARSESMASDIFDLIEALVQYLISIP